MHRRAFLKTATSTVGVIAWPSAKPAAATPSTHTETSFLLSKHGCGRATGYAETNKIITRDGKTHVAWLDSVDKAFRVRIRTRDRKTATWSMTYDLGEAYDNHGGPALTIDREGYLHCVSYPHHHPFRYRRSTRPNDASQWDDVIEVGERCTYPTLVCARDDTLLLTCRQSDRENPWRMNLYTKPPGKDWQGPRAILRSQHTGYSHFQEALAWSPDHRTLHMSCRIYSGKARHGHTVGYLRSRDLGVTWERADGQRATLPATAESISVIASDHSTGNPGLRCGAIAVDPAGVPHVLYSSAATQPSEAWIASLDASSTWRRRALRDVIASRWPGRGLTLPGGLTIGRDGRIYIALTLINPPATDDETVWGHPSSEVMWLESADAGKTFTSRLVSQRDPNIAHWLPNLERPTGHNQIDVPGLIYTAGTKGENNKQIVANDVYWYDAARAT
jgi:hypothetical protein